MALLSYLEPGDPFPPTSEALSYPNGLLAAGGKLDTATLVAAYRRGIFPWYEAPQPVLWWSPDPRLVLYPDELRISKSLQRKSLISWLAFIKILILGSNIAFHSAVRQIYLM